CRSVKRPVLGGPVDIGDWGLLSGNTLADEFWKIGAPSVSGMGTAIGKDVPAYVMVNGSPAEAKNINAEGLRRRGFNKEDIATLTKAYKIIYRRGLTLDDAMRELQPLLSECAPLQVLIDSLQSSTRGIVR